MIFMVTTTVPSHKAMEVAKKFKRVDLPDLRFHEHNRNVIHHLKVIILLLTHFFL